MSKPLAIGSKCDMLAYVNGRPVIARSVIVVSLSPAVAMVQDIDDNTTHRVHVALLKAW